MTLITTIFLEVLLLLFPPFGKKLARVIMIEEFIDWKYSLLALFRIERAVKLQLNFFKWSQFKWFRTLKGTLVIIILDATHALEAKYLPTTTITTVWFFSNVVAYCTFVLCCFSSIFYILFGLVCSHNNTNIIRCQDSSQVKNKIR